MQTLKLYSVRVWDGADRCNHKFYLTSRAEADLYLKNNTYDHIDEVELEIFDTLEEYYERDQAKLKERALSKLTEAERRALGF